MKKKKVIAGVAAGAALAGLTVGGFAFCGMTQQNLYGPPPDYSERQSESLSEEESLRASEEASAQALPEETFDPANMEVQDVYGPPEYFENAE
ncbi:MAG: hypothetical protein IJR51_00400 [Clostridia bacterium]|nr:hypothetical protein [Clostridia bacterium]MBQ9505593.1 hypothetical protein [Clostridia bacterium]MBR5424162.1 hypothetical protein [Clostridia bacterium]